MYRVAVDEHGFHIQPSAKLYIGERVTDHDALPSCNVRELFDRLFEQPRQRLTAVALLFIVRAKVEAVDMGSLCEQKVLQRGMNGLHIGGGVESQGYTALIAHDDHADSGPIQPSDPFNYAWKETKVRPVGHIASLRHLFIQNAVAIKENSLHSFADSIDFRVCHSVMITITTCANFVAQSAYHRGSSLLIANDLIGVTIMSTFPNAADVFGKAIAEHLEIVRELAGQQNTLEAIARAMAATLRSGGKILWCGNGGSAADSQHLAAEIVGRFRRERRGLPSVALTTDTSILTAIANDYGYDAVFARQIEALGVKDDLLVGISTSGNSPNVVMALQTARSMGLSTVGFTGEGSGKMASLADHLFAVASKDTARTQEAHILAGHMLCDWIELDWIQSRAVEEAQIPAVSQTGGAR